MRVVGGSMQLLHQPTVTDAAACCYEAKAQTDATHIASWTVTCLLVV